MTRIFWGFIFIFFAFTFTLNLGTFILAIDILPDFVGYALLFLGISKYATNKNFKIAKTSCIVMFLITLMYYIAITFNFIIYNTYLVILVNLIQLFTIFHVVKGCEVAASKFEGEDLVRRMYKVLYFIIIIGLLGLIGLFLPAVGFVLMIVSIIVEILLVVMFYKLQKLEQYYKPSEHSQIESAFAEGKEL